LESEMCRPRETLRAGRGESEGIEGRGLEGPQSNRRCQGCCFCKLPSPYLPDQADVQHEGKKAQTRLDKAQAQLMKLGNDASLAARPQGLVILNPIHPGKGVPTSVSSCSPITGPTDTR
jgi:hypothetical protein